MTNSHVTQTKVGEWFGLSAIKVGRILTAHGLKDRNGPTRLAVEGGYAKSITTRDQLTFWVWDARKTAQILDQELADCETPYIDQLVAQVGDSLAEARRHRSEGNDLLAELILEQTYDGVPPPLIGLIKDRLGGAACREAVRS